MLRASQAALRRCVSHVRRRVATRITPQLQLSDSVTVTRTTSQPIRLIHSTSIVLATHKPHQPQLPAHAKPWLDQRTDKPNFSLLARVPNAQKSNIVLMGPPGSGKSSLGRVVAKRLGMSFLDIDDDYLEPYWKCTVAEKLAALGDDGFVQAEGEALCNLNVKNTVISLSGSNPLHPRSLEHVAKDGLIFYLDIEPTDILARCAKMKIDRIVGQSTTTLASILAYRQSIYENSYDVRFIMPSSGMNVDELSERLLQKIQLIKESGRHGYVSTRGYDGSDRKTGLDFLDVVQKGLSPDRGLFLPSHLKHIAFPMDELARLASLQSYEELALRVMEKFPLGERVHPSELRRILYEAYSTFDNPKILPLKYLKVQSPASNKTTKLMSPSSSTSFFHPDMYLMETFHGPTASFKDLSLQLLPKFLQLAQEKDTNHKSKSSSQKETIGLLVATSGDTGTAALDGFSRQEGVPVIVLYPSNGVSIVQRAQMQTTGGDVLVLGVDSDFDFCQKLVKDIFNDEKLKQEFRSIVPNLTLSSANSMNWGRFLPQIVFSISSYLQLVQRGQINLGEQVNLVVPTGNFGNILGAVFAKVVLGLPLKKIICASNSNNILFDFLKTGNYDLRKRKFTQTISPSIDILVSSNLERFLYLLSDSNSAEIKTLFEQLQTDGHFNVKPELLSKIKALIDAGWTTEEECLSTIRETFQKTGEFIDPHTAVAVHVANHLLQSDPHTPVIISSTAHYGKFPNAMCHALGHAVPSGDETSLARMFKHLERISPETYAKTMHRGLAQLVDAPILHQTHCSADLVSVVNEIKKFLRAFAEKKQKP